MQQTLPAQSNIDPCIHAWHMACVSSWHLITISACFLTSLTVLIYFFMLQLRTSVFCKTKSTAVEIRETAFCWIFRKL